MMLMIDTIFFFDIRHNEECMQTRTSQVRDLFQGQMLCFKLGVTKWN